MDCIHSPFKLQVSVESTCVSVSGQIRVWVSCFLDIIDSRGIGMASAIRDKPSASKKEIGALCMARDRWIAGLLLSQVLRIETSFAAQRAHLAEGNIRSRAAFRNGKERHL